MKQIAIVTGASSGMGRDFALELINEPNIDEIWLLARRKGRLYDLEQDIKAIKKSKGASLPEVRAIDINLSGRTGISSFKALLDAEKLVEEKSGGFKISWLINNAGFGTYGPFNETPLSNELDMIDINCTALTGILGEALPYLSDGSIVVNTASLASFLPLGNFAVYGATKAFVLSLSVALAAELKDKGIKVCALCPGPVSTEFANVASNGARPQVLHGLPSIKVVRHCIKQAKKGKNIAIMALKWKFKAAASRFVGRYAGARFTYKFCKRPRNN